MLSRSDNEQAEICLVDCTTLSTESRLINGFSSHIGSSGTNWKPKNIDLLDYIRDGKLNVDYFALNGGKPFSLVE